jgi:isopenicillin N synthase-like dioxygenase
MEAYVDAMNELGRSVAAMLSRSLGLPPTYFAAALAEPLTYSQLLYYPSIPAERSGNRLGAGAHVDWGMLTILLQDDVGGLDVYVPGAGWQAAPPVPDTFVIILGEMMIRLTDGFYRSAMHRVRNDTNDRGTDRYSMPTFFDPSYESVIACVPTRMPVSGMPRYPVRTVAAHMQEMAQQTLSARDQPLA